MQSLSSEDGTDDQEYLLICEDCKEPTCRYQPNQMSLKKAVTYMYIEYLCVYYVVCCVNRYLHCEYVRIITTLS